MSLTCTVLASAFSLGTGLFTLGAPHHINLDHRNLPDLGPFTLAFVLSANKFPAV